MEYFSYAFLVHHFMQKFLRVSFCPFPFPFPFWCCTELNFFFFFAEFFHTEKSHVRTLKVLDRLFFRPLIENSFMSRELVDQLFPNLEEVLAQHNQYNQKMKERAKAGFPVGNIGDMLCEMVSQHFSICYLDRGKLTFVQVSFESSSRLRVLLTSLKPNEKSFFVRQNLCHGTLTIMPLQKLNIQKKKKVLTNDYGRRYYGAKLFLLNHSKLLPWQH